MRPDKSIAKRSDRELDLEQLWRELGEVPPGKPGGPPPVDSSKQQAPRADRKAS